MKPFNLEQFKAGKPAVTIDGRQAKFLGIINNGQEDNMVVAVKGHEGKEDVYFYYPSGKYYQVGDSEADLFMAPEKIELPLGFRFTQDTVGNHHPEIKKLVVAWCDKIPYMHIWDKVKLADDITRCFNKITKQK